jgi:hypothetical protein
MAAGEFKRPVTVAAAVTATYRQRRKCDGFLLLLHNMAFGNVSEMNLVFMDICYFSCRRTHPVGVEGAHLGAKNLKRMQNKSKTQKPNPRPLKLTPKPYTLNPEPKISF